MLELKLKYMLQTNIKKHIHKTSIHSNKNLNIHQQFNGYKREASSLLVLIMTSNINKNSHYSHI